MASEGMRLTSFYVPAPSCAPSRNALMTGCYPARNYVSRNKPEDALENATHMKDLDMSKLNPYDREFVSRILEEDPKAILARHTWGLPKSEITIPELLKTAGYSTIMFGKWHLGEHPRHHPRRHGFDEYWGVPQSISVRAPRDNNPWMIDNHYYFPMQPLYDNDSIIGFQPDSSLLTKQYTEKAVTYIKTHRQEPFFMWLSYAMPHVPIGVSEEFEGVTGQGLYADVISEIDWSVGQIIDVLKKEELAENTLVFFTSDNGPSLAYGEHAGSAGPLREGKGTLFEGGVREPAIAWWPGIIPANTVNENPAMTIDLFPTFAEIAGIILPENEIDGKSIFQMFIDPEIRSPQEAYYFFNMGNFPSYGKLVAVRKNDWKLMMPYKFKSVKNLVLGKNGEMVPLVEDSIGLSLFNLKDDISERISLVNDFPEIVNDLKSLGIEFQEYIESNQRGVDWVRKNEEWNY
jgi:arylsulfatase A-like enzyme